jgi:hypothetical protein
LSGLSLVIFRPILWFSPSDKISGKILSAVTFILVKKRRTNWIRKVSPAKASNIKEIVHRNSNEKLRAINKAAEPPM